MFINLLSLLAFSAAAFQTESPAKAIVLGTICFLVCHFTRLMWRALADPPYPVGSQVFVSNHCCHLYGKSGEVVASQSRWPGFSIQVRINGVTEYFTESDLTGPNFAPRPQVGDTVRRYTDNNCYLEHGYVQELANGMARVYWGSLRSTRWVPVWGIKEFSNNVQPFQVGQVAIAKVPDMLDCPVYIKEMKGTTIAVCDYHGQRKEFQTSQLQHS